MRQRYGVTALLLSLLAATLLIPGLPAAGQTPPKELTQSQVRLFNSTGEVVDGAFPGLLVIPKTPSNYRDEKYLKAYHAACHVYVPVPSSDADSEPVYQRRFLVCAAELDSLEFIRQVAKLLVLLYGERRDRLHDDHPRNLPVVNVWLTERVEAGLSPDTGGEQFQNQIYLYNIHRERPAIEWAREIAHEYGHYALPGISGFKAPEEWANGVLGERLFMKWLRDDLKAGRLKSEQLSFATPDLLDDYYAHSIWPLIRRIMRDGVDIQKITRANSDGMDYYTGLAMYVDTLYGSTSLVDAMAITHSATSLTLPRALDFLTGVLKSLRTEKEISLSLPALGSSSNENTIRFYLPSGAWSVRLEGSTLSWRLSPDPNISVLSALNLITARRGGWYRLAYLRTSAPAPPARFILRRHEQTR